MNCTKDLDESLKSCVRSCTHCYVPNSCPCMLLVRRNRLVDWNMVCLAFRSRTTDKRPMVLGHCDVPNDIEKTRCNAVGHELMSPSEMLPPAKTGLKAQLSSKHGTEVVLSSATVLQFPKADFLISFLRAANHVLGRIEQDFGIHLPFALGGRDTRRRMMMSGLPWDVLFCPSTDCASIHLLQF